MSAINTDPAFNATLAALGDLAKQVLNTKRSDLEALVKKLDDSLEKLEALQLFFRPDVANDLVPLFTGMRAVAAAAIAMHEAVQGLKDSADEDMIARMTALVAPPAADPEPAQ